MSISKNTNKIFLSMTAIEEFWNLSEETVFLGSWCFINGENPPNAKDSARARLLESPYSETDLDDIYSYLDEQFENILPVVSCALNKMHGKDYSNNYWRILIGPWLQYYIHSMFDRFSYIEKALNDYPNLTTFLLSKESYVTPTDTKEFVYLVESDGYNLQILSRVLRFFGKNFPEKEMKISHNKDYKKSIKTSLKSKILHAIERFIVKKTDLFYNKRIYCIDSYLPRIATIKLMLASYGKIAFISDNYYVNDNINLNISYREKLTKLNLGDSLFSNCISSLISLDMPKSFVENYSILKKSATNYFPKKSAVIASSNAWYTKERFKFWAADQSENNTVLLGLQHGGADCGARKNFIHTDLEISIVDYYFSWGWGRTGCNSTIVPMPANKLIKENSSTNSLNSGLDILWVMSTAPRYLVYFPRITSYFEKYLDFQMDFVNSLSVENIDNLRIRTHYQDHGWGIRLRLNRVVKNIRFDDNKIPFYKSIKNCKLCVFDHLSTSATESLALNKPTILFWSSKANKIRSEYVEYFDLLRSVGILYDSPEAAAKAVDEIYNNVNLWWNDIERKKAVISFNQVFARMQNDGVKAWKDAMIKLS